MPQLDQFTYFAQFFRCCLIFYVTRSHYAFILCRSLVVSFLFLWAHPVVIMALDIIWTVKISLYVIANHLCDRIWVTIPPRYRVFVNIFLSNLSVFYYILGLVYSAFYAATTLIDPLWMLPSAHIELLDPDASASSSAPVGPEGAPPAAPDTLVFRDPIMLDALRGGLPGGSPFPGWAQNLVNDWGGHDEVFRGHDWLITGEPPVGPWTLVVLFKNGFCCPATTFVKCLGVHRKLSELNGEAGFRLLKWPNKRFPFINAWKQLLKIVEEADISGRG